MCGLLTQYKLKLFLIILTFINVKKKLSTIYQFLNSSSSINIGSVLELGWRDNLISYRIDRCWAAKSANAQYDDLANSVVLVENGCPKFNWMVAPLNKGVPTQVSFPVFAFLNRFIIQKNVLNLIFIFY